MAMTSKEKSEKRRKEELKKGRKRREMSLTDIEFDTVKTIIRELRTL